MTRTTLHFVFSPSGAASLAEALEQAGRDDQVVTFFDDLSFGPINPPHSISTAGAACTRYSLRPLTGGARKFLQELGRSARRDREFMSWLASRPPN